LRWHLWLQAAPPLSLKKPASKKEADHGFLKILY
jgi:hypothetical protein